MTCNQTSVGTTIQQNRNRNDMIRMIQGYIINNIIAKISITRLK